MEMKNIYTLVGFLLVGLLMIGLVSGAGYNIVVPATATDDSSSSGGGGGTTGGAITYTVSDEQFINSYTKALRVKDSLRFSVGGESHNLKINSLTASTITINITSELQQATLSVEDTRRFELSGDNYYDLSVTLNSINMTTSRAEITILSINTEITDETIVEEAKKESEASKIKEVEDKSESFFDKFGLWIFIAVVLILVLSVVIYFKRKKK